MHGTKNQVVQVTVLCGLFLAQQLRAAGLKISTKTTVGASNWQLAKDLAKRLAIGGLEIQATQVAKDLGIDSSCARTRRVKQQKARQAKAGKRFSRTGKFARNVRAAGKLAFT